MDGTFTRQEGRSEEREEETQLGNRRLKLCPNPFSVLGFWVSKNLRNLYCKARFSSISGFCYSRRIEFFDGNVVNNSVFFVSDCCFLEEEEEMSSVISEFLGDKKDGVEEKSENVSNVGTFGDLIAEKGRESSSSSDFLTSETTGHEEEEEAEEEQSHSSSEESSSSPATLGWPVDKPEAQDCTSQCREEPGEKSHLDDSKLEKKGSELSGMCCAYNFVAFFFASFVIFCVWITMCLLI